jgi:parallel beta-helix repeat protein
MKVKSVAVVLCLAPVAAFCDTLNVPADYPTIHAAVVASSPGDEIVILPATYMEHDIVIETALMIRSAVPGASAVIDGQGLGSVMIIEANDAVVEISDIAFVNGETGVLIEKDSGLEVTLDRCALSSNAEYGLYSNSPSSFESPTLTLRHCVISQNAASGIFVQSSQSVEISDCEVSGNGDSGVFIVGSDLECRDTRFLGNHSGQMGGGMALVGSSAEMYNVVFEDNSATDAGGGVSIHATGTYLFDDCSFASCSAPVGSQAYIHNMDGFTIAATFNCCEIDTSQFGGPVWDAGVVQITQVGCAVAVESRNWSSVKGMFR